MPRKAKTAVADAAPAAPNVVMFTGDTLMNLVSGIGTEKGKSFHNQYVFYQLSKLDLETAYRGDWIARKVVDIPAEDSVREWRAWQAEDTQITLIEAAEKTLKLKQRLLRGTILSRLYGGGALVLGVRGQGDAARELKVEKVGKDQLEFVHAVSCYDITAQAPINDITSPWFGHPEYYERTIPGKDPQRIHPSRVIRLVARPLPDPNADPSIWGDSILQAVDDAVRNAGIVSGGIAELVHEAKVDVLRIPNLTENMTTRAYSDKLIRRFSLTNQLKSMINALLMDKNEEWERVQTSFGGLPDILKMYMLIASGAADIPAVRMLMQSATGLNSTGESDIRNYYDKCASDRNMYLVPAIEPLDEILIRSALGSRPLEIYCDWNPLWQMSETEKADIAQKKASAFATVVNTGLVNPDVMREAWINQAIEDGTYPGIELLVDEYGSEPEEPDDEEIMSQFSELQGRQKQLFPNAETKQIAGPKKKTKAKDARFSDATPRTLYVRRDLLNVKDLRAWAKSQGIKNIVPDPHVTICYSRSELDWTKVSEEWGSDEKGRLVVKPGGPRIVEPLGTATAVLLFASNALSWRHADILRAGATSDYDEYQPHVTITYSGLSESAVSNIQPYRGALVFGPEIFEEVRQGGFMPPEEVDL